MPRGDGQQTRTWRSREFVQPLLLTLAGALATYAVNLALFPVESCTGSTSCGYGWFAQLIAGLFLIVGMLITGIVVSLPSGDPWMAGRGILVAVVILSLAVSVRAVLSGGQEVLEGFVGSALLLLAFILLGFWLGRLYKDARRAS